MLEDADDVYVAGDRDVDGEGLFRTMLSVTSDPVYALDADRRIVAVDDEMASLTGHDPDELLGANVSLVLGSDDVEALEMMVAKVSREADTMAGEFDILAADGSVRRCELRVAVPNPDAGTVVAAVRDVTSLRRREERIEVLDRVLRHNIRNKIGAVMGYLDTVLDESDDEETRRLTQIAIHEADELRALSDKARRFHKLLELDPVRTTVEDLSKTVDPVVADHRDEFPDAEYVVDVPDHPPAFVDRELVEAALTEVVGNAVEHHSGDSPTVEIGVESSDDRVYLTVADDGPGIPPEERSAIMEGNERPLYHASGLGIWFVKWCLRLSGGTLTIESNDPRGTIVTLSLPRADASPTP